MFWRSGRPRCRNSPFYQTLWLSIVQVSALTFLPSFPSSHALSFGPPHSDSALFRSYSPPLPGNRWLHSSRFPATRAFSRGFSERFLPFSTCKVRRSLLFSTKRHPEASGPTPDFPHVRRSAPFFFFLNLRPPENVRAQYGLSNPSSSQNPPYGTLLTGASRLSIFLDGRRPLLFPH